MTILDDIKGLNPRQAAALKAQRLTEFIASYLPYTYTYTGYDGASYKITVNAVTYDTTRELLSITDMGAVKDRKTTLVLDLPFEYYNPPFQVVTGTNGTDPEGHVILIVEENPLEAMRRMVGQTVERQGSSQ